MVVRRRDWMVEGEEGESWEVTREEGEQPNVVWLGFVSAIREACISRIFSRVERP